MSYQESTMIGAEGNIVVSNEGDSWYLFNPKNQDSIKIGDQGMLLFSKIGIPQYIGDLRTQWAGILTSDSRSEAESIVATDALIDTLLSGGFASICSGIVDIPSQSIIYSGYPDVPDTVALHVTNECNLSCSYCYNASNRTQACKDIHSALEWEEQLLALQSQGVKSFEITGGEPMLRKDLFPLYAKLKSKGAKITVLTNGTLIQTIEDAECMRDFSDMICLSIDSHIPEKHDKFRGVGTHAKAVDAAKLLTKVGATWKGKAVFHPGNKGPALETKKFILDLGANSFDISLMESTDSDKYMASVSYDITINKRTSPKRDQENNITTFDEKLGYPCGAARNEIAIDASGEVYPCRSLMYPEMACGSIFDTNFQEVWKNAKPLEEFRNIDYRKIEVCGSCSSLTMCLGGCRAKIYAATKSLYGPPRRYLCALKKRRMAEHIRFHLDRSINAQTQQEPETTS